MRKRKVRGAGADGGLGNKEGEQSEVSAYRGVTGVLAKGRGQPRQGVKMRVWDLISVFCRIETLIPRSRTSDPARELLVPNATC